MFRPTARPLSGLARPATLTPPRLVVRHYSSRRNDSASPGFRGLKRQNKKAEVESEADLGSQMTAKPSAERLRHFVTFVPGTFVTMPLSNVPKAPKAFLAYQWYSLKARVTDFLGIVGLRWQSKPSIFGKARIHIKRGAALAAGKALHARLGQAIAEGDRGALRQITLPALFDTLSNTLGRRNKSERMTWEIVEHHGARLAAHRAMLMPAPFPSNLVVEQAVVAIDTTQKLERADARSGEVIPGSTKMQRRTEYLAVHRFLSTATYDAEPWAVIGNVRETTLKDWQEWTKYEQDHRDRTVDKKIKQARDGTL